MSTIHHAKDKYGIPDDYSLQVCEYDTGTGPQVALAINFHQGHIWLPGDEDTAKMLIEGGNELRAALARAEAAKEPAA